MGGGWHDFARARRFDKTSLRAIADWITIANNDVTQKVTK